MLPYADEAERAVSVCGGSGRDGGRNPVETNAFWRGLACLVELNVQHAQRDMRARRGGGGTRAQIHVVCRYCMCENAVR